MALPADATMRDRVNRLKRREPWRPFGPVARREIAHHFWNDNGALSRYMVGTATLTARGAEALPAVTHVDGTTRPQVIDDDTCPTTAAVLDGLGSAGVPPVLINTSFNEKGQPIVNSEAEALEAFRRIRLDFLVLGDRLVTAKDGA